jgi:membrane-associated protein
MIEHILLNAGIGLAYLIYFIVVFAESGLIVGFFLPGDTLLFTVGLLASQGHFSLPILLILGIIGAISGDSLGYYFGRKVGPQIFSPEKKRRFLNQSHLTKAQDFYDKHGVKTIILARFTPFARTFAPILAGVSNMDYKLFVTYNILGGVFWVLTVTCAGYFLGEAVPNIDHYILPIIIGIIVVTVLPAAFSAWRSTRKKA